MARPSGFSARAWPAPEPLMSRRDGEARRGSSDPPRSCGTSSQVEADEWLAARSQVITIELNGSAVSFRGRTLQEVAEEATEHIRKCVNRMPDAGAGQSREERATQDRSRARGMKRAATRGR